MGLCIDVHLDVSRPPKWLWSFKVKQSWPRMPGDLGLELVVKTHWYSRPLLFVWAAWRALKGTTLRWQPSERER